MEGPGTAGDLTTNLRPRGGAHDDITKAADNIVGDFRRLIALVSETIDIAACSDHALIERLSKTKKMAERGLKLSTRLSTLTHKKCR